MWMMGYSDGGGEINTIQDPFTGRKLRPLMPRPATAAAAAPPCLTRIHGTDLFALNHHLALSEQNKRDLTSATAQQVVVSSRWNPTPEQLQTLEELYRRGTRTPSAEQIQHITSQLRRYGKIEGKNVFYWFQNHKARERQKRRRQLETFPEDDGGNNNNGEKREPSGANRTLFEVEQTKNWASPTNSSTAAEKSGEAEAECKADDGWVQFDDDAAQRRRNATWRLMNLSCSSSSSATALPSSKLATATMQFKPQDFINIFFQPYNTNNNSSLNPHRSSAAAAEAEAQTTLQLFPLESGRRGSCDEECSDNEEEEEEGEESGVDMSNSGSHVAPCQFFEFLPLKN